MNFNLHTHTFRCHHATGTEREYIENAISSGIKLLGFSEHIPYPFDDGHESCFRLYKADMSNYFDDLKALQKEYKNDIEILIGFESEYYPKYFDKLLDLIAPYRPQYLLLGQHFTMNEEDGVYCMLPSDSEDRLVQYVDQVITAMETGKFTYVAHPDVCNFTGDENVYRHHMIRLCVAAKRLNIPLELNFLGLMGHRNYPCKRFFKIAAEVGNDIVLGCDAHNPAVMITKEPVEAALAFLNEFDIKPIESINIRYLEW